MSSSESPSQSADRPARKQTSTQRSQQASSRSDSSGQGQRQQRSSGGSGRATPRQIAAHAAQALRELTGREAESVTGVQQADDGWTVQIEVVESHRIPDSADLLALYDVHTDASGELTGYRRTRRYNRGHTGEE